MRKLFFALTMFLYAIDANAQLNFAALTYTPQYPQANNKINFEYNTNYSPLIRQKNIEVVVYLFSEKGQKVVEPNTINANGILKGSIDIDSNTTAIAFSFSSNKEKDVNSSKGYIIPIYNNNKMPVEGYYSAACNLQAGFGENLFGMQTDAPKGLAILEDGIIQYPSLKEKPQFLNQYYSVLTSVKKKDALPIIEKELQALQAKGNLTEPIYNMLIQVYSRNKNKTKADSLTNAMRATFPDGNWKMEKMVNDFFLEKNSKLKLDKYYEIVTNYPPKKDVPNSYDQFKSMVANAFAKDNNLLEFKKINNSLPKALSMSNYNNVAWPMAEKGEDLQTAKQMAKEATEYTQAEISKPSEKKPDYLTNKQWLENRKGNYAMFGDTYAYILYQLGDYKTGLPIAKEAATINKFKDAELNERYALLAEKALPLAESKKLVENFIKEGAATIKTKEVLKSIYKTEKKSDVGYDKYLAKLEASAKEIKRAEIVKSMINEAAPSFTLKDFEGKEVSLESLKGKTLIIDFWATWCGPCIASMPAMNKALAKYKTNKEVAFIFIDTWETVDNKLQNAKDFMEKKKYPFYVLMDNENKMVEDFKVSGIPTKFIIDKTGKIRFKAVGFSGKDDELIDELDTMILLVNK